MKKVRYDCRPTERTAIRDKLLPVFSMKIVLTLIRDGYRVREVKENSKYPGRLVHYFDNIPEIRAYLPISNFSPQDKNE